MSVEFNPYREWLGLESGPSPPNYYLLLGIEPDEPDVGVIHAAADRAMAHVRSHRPGVQARAWAGLLDEIAAAKSCLTNPEQRLQYDRMRSGRAASAVRPSPSATPASGSIAEAMAPYDPYAEFARRPKTRQSGRNRELGSRRQSRRPIPPAFRSSEPLRMGLPRLTRRPLQAPTVRSAK